jgi:adenine-specific DNA methylase
MGQQLYAIAIKTAGGLTFRVPTAADLDAVTAADDQYAVSRVAWENLDYVPSDPLPMQTEAWTHGNTPAQYDATSFADLFTHRQLLSLCTAVEVLHDISDRIDSTLEPELGKAVKTYLAFAIDKACDYNSRLASFNVKRQNIRNTFDRHDFSFKWTYTEFDAAHNLFPWVVNQVIDAYSGLANLYSDSQARALVPEGESSPTPLKILHGSAADLASLRTGSVSVLVTDPPYYDNVNYAECSDFFYVWMKRTLGKVYPEVFQDALTNKEDEAVANPVRFSGMDRNKNELASLDYQRKMEACFREMHRVLHDDGVLTVMFTHKKVEAWDTLGSSLLDAGFTVDASWPVHTEPEHSLHQAKKNAARSTILLTCRKREAITSEVWWDDLKRNVREVAREMAAVYEGLGIRGVDLYIATFGPVLSVISERWPVFSSEMDEVTGKPKVLRPEAALEIAREEVVRLRKQGLLLGRDLQFDPVTDWYLMAWDAFRAEEFPADEARKLALAVGNLELETTLIGGKKVLGKKGSSVVLKKPNERRKRGHVDEEVEVFECLLDAVHTAMLVFDEDGPNACQRWLGERRLDSNMPFQALLQAMVNAIPATKDKTGYIRPEMATLDRMNDALAFGIEFPPDAIPVPQVVQGALVFGSE